MKPIKRVVEPEWLDELPAADQRAVRSRQDLRRVNALMGNASVVASLLRRRIGDGETCHLVELGAGDGAFALSLTHRLAPAVRVTEVTLVDRVAPATELLAEEFSRLGCKLNLVHADVFDWLAEARPKSVLVANLFLHHFQADQLRKLLQLAALRSQTFVACEPRRSELGLAGSRLLGLIGCNDVTRHDAVVSVRAGFVDQEISALWPRYEEWTLEEHAAGLFSHGFAARRKTSTQR